MGCSSSNTEEKKAPKKIVKVNPVQLLIPEKNGETKINHTSLVVESKEPITKNYKVIEKLGAGSFGTVYKVKHLNTNQIRALKVIKLSALKVQDVKSNKLNEIEIIKRIEHPNIIKLYEYYQDNNYFYLVTEMIEGGELYDQIAKISSYTEKNAAIIMEQLLSVVFYLHSNGIVHRDLKPENIMLETKSSGDLSIKIIDFGTAIEFGKDPLTLTIGTAYYIAPEVINQSYSNKCDLWSIGVIMYVLLSGYPPFDGKDDDKIMDSICIGKFNFDGSEWKTVTQEAKSLIKKLLTVDPSKRITAEQALLDPWIVNNKKTNNVNVSTLKDQINNMRNFYQKHRFQQVSVAFLVHQMTSSENEKKLRLVFKSMDENGDGRLSYNELKNAYKKAFTEKEFSEQDFDIWASFIDQDHSGFIEYNEFLRASIDIDTIINEKNLKEAFKHFDKDNSGFLSAEEIKSVLGVAGSSQEDKEVIQNILKELDSNGDNKISFEEFKTLMKEHKI